MNRRNYCDPSRLENLNHGEDQRNGLTMTELRKRFNMKPRQMKSRHCLVCSSVFDSEGDRICSKCKKGWGE